MNITDAGHDYWLDSFDGNWPQRLTFMKREGEGYPFNVGHHPGTNCQEVIRALIDRVKYLQRQIPCAANESILSHLRLALRDFELRAALRHNRALPVFDLNEIELQPTCAGCGHIGCTGNHRK